MTSAPEPANVIATPVLDAEEAAGTLWRDLEIWLLNVSASGCLLESRHAMRSGTAGTLRLRVGEAEYVDQIRVTRCVPVQGAGATFRIGAEFVAAVPGNGRSLCDLASAGRLQRINRCTQSGAPSVSGTGAPSVSGTGAPTPCVES
jgi:hypothetical protein